MVLQIPEPMLPTELEDSYDIGAEQDWTARALRELARQLGVGNDYYYPLIGAAQLLTGPSISRWCLDAALALQFD